MRDDRDTANPEPLAYEADSLLQLPAGVRGAAERRGFLWRPFHLGIGIGKPAKAVKIERPDVEPGGAELVTPGPPVKPMRDRQPARKRPAMHIKDDPIAATRRRETAKEQRAPIVVARNAEMLLPRIELENHHDGTFGCA